MSKVRTRFAPSPTGRMHVGNLRTVILGYVCHRVEGTVLRTESVNQ